MALTFTDMAHYQCSKSAAGVWTPTSAALAAINKSDGVIVKATEGVNADAAHTALINAVRAAKKMAGHYHFGWAGSAVTPQVSAFLKVAGARAGESLWLDHEAEGSSPSPMQWPSPAARVRFVLDFTSAVSAATGAKCGLYVNKSEWKTLLNTATLVQKAALLRLPLWIAAPTDPVGKPAISEPFVLHQYGTVGGVDADYSPLTVSGFKSLGVPASVAPAPKPPVVPGPAPLPAKPAKPAAYPGKPIGWSSTGPAVTTVQWCLRGAGYHDVLPTGKYDAATRAAIGSYQKGHKYAFLKDQPCGVGALKARQYASLLTYYSKA